MMLSHGHQKTRQENGEETCLQGQEITFGLYLSASSVGRKAGAFFGSFTPENGGERVAPV
jgi:hypothetical protein